MAIAAPRDSQWEELCKTIGRSDLIGREGFEDALKRDERREEVLDVVTSWTRKHTTREVVKILGGRVPVGPVNTARDIFNDPHTEVRNMLVEVEQPGNNEPVILAGCPIKFTETPSGIYRRPPKLGEHTEEILAEAGLAPPSRSDHEH